MLERRRAARNYQIVPGDELNDHDVELGETATGQETGVMSTSEPPNVTEELDNWDENGEDWDDDEQADNGQGKKALEATTGEKRSD